MWCSSCRADVAAELSTDNRRMLCARCQSELGVAASVAPKGPATPRVMETERDARELLARWSTQNLLEVTPAATSSSPPITKPSGETKSSGENSALLDGPSGFEGRSGFEGLAGGVKRSPMPTRSLNELPTGASEPAHQEGSEADSAEDFQDCRDHAAANNAAPIAERRRQRPQPTQPSLQPTIEKPVRASTTVSSQGLEPHRDAVAQDHNQDRVVREALHKQLNRRLGWSTFMGQVCAYGGVALLTCGSVLVVSSYYGGPPQYLPTGLLTAAVGQMILFLGVITLISSGMEQTVHEVSWRIDHLADEIFEMGEVLDDLRLEQRKGRGQSEGPKSNPAENSPQRKAA